MSLLEIEGLTIRFGGLVALDGVDLHVEEGEIHALIGPNGAGKTTLVNLLTRIYDPSAGAIRFDGHNVLSLRPHQVMGCGISRIFQHMELFSNLTALENVLAGCHSLGRTTLLQAAMNVGFARRERAALVDLAREILAFAGLEEMADRPAATLTGGQGRLLGLARALVAKPKLLLLDELVAGLNSHERSKAQKLVRRLRDERHITILAIEHDMRFIMGIADRISVLNFGRKIAAGHPADVTRDPAVIEAYLGSGRYSDP